jgi:glutathione S-transferase
VPVLVHDGSVIVRSSVICAYLDDVSDPPRAIVERDDATMVQFAGRYLHSLRNGDFAISFGRRLAGPGGARGTADEMPDPARRERQRA